MNIVGTRRFYMGGLINFMEIGYVALSLLFTQEIGYS